MEPLISIQILNWNRANDTQRAIGSALNQSYKNTEIVLIDNGSTDNSIELTRKNFPSIKIVALGKNYGCPGGRNLGVDHCNGEYIFYLDNDGVLHEDAVKNAYNTISKYSDIGIVTGIVYDFSSPSEIDVKCKIRNDIRYYFNNFQGGICMHAKSIYSKTGLYPSHFKYGAEEFYMTLKILENDFRIIKDESVILWHKRSSVARDRNQELINSYFNKLYTSIVLFPTSKALQFSLYFIPSYTKHAYNEGVFKPFLKSFFKNYFKNIRMALKHRDPISKDTYKKFKSKRIYIQ